MKYWGGGAFCADNSYKRMSVIKGKSYPGDVAAVVMCCLQLLFPLLPAAPFPLVACRLFPSNTSRLHALSQQKRAHTQT